MPTAPQSFIERLPAIGAFSFYYLLNRAYEADISQVQNEKIIFSTGVNKNIIMLEMIKNEKEDSVKLLTDSF